jgi:hypothetical protein
MSARLGERNSSPSSDNACSRSAPSVASDSASWIARRSGTLRRAGPLISRPAATAALDATSTATPAARLVIQKKCSPSAASSMGQDCLVTTADGVPLDEVVPSSVAVESRPSPLEPSSVTVPDVVEPVDAVEAAACSPIEPEWAIRPHARTKPERVPAATPRRIRVTRRARAARRSRPSAARSEVDGVDTRTMVGARRQGCLNAPWGLPETGAAAAAGP